MWLRMARDRDKTRPPEFAYGGPAAPGPARLRTTFSRVKAPRAGLSRKEVSSFHLIFLESWFFPPCMFWNHPGLAGRPCQSPHCKHREGGRHPNEPRGAGTLRGVTEAGIQFQDAEALSSHTAGSPSFGKS